MKASDLFVRALEAEGVEYVFAIPGEENLDLLEAQGLVVRADAPADRRVKHVTLTAVGRKSLKAAREVASAMRDEMVAPFAPHEVDTAELFLHGLTSQFEKVRKAGMTDE